MKNQELKFDLFESEYKINLTQAVRVLGAIYGWKAEVIFKKRVSTIQYWLKRAEKSDKLTVERAMLVLEIVNPHKEIPANDFVDKLINFFSRRKRSRSED